MSITLTQTEIPLAKLVVHPENVRAKTSDTEPENDIMGLATSIKAIGLINPLTVQKLNGGKWGVLAGKRRLAALGALVEAQDHDDVATGATHDGGQVLAQSIKSSFNADV